jgi:hypothetical protein
MSETTPLLASSVRYPSEYGGWSASLEPDERIPPPPKPLYIDVSSKPWAVSPGLFAAYSARSTKDEDLRYEQTIWTVEKLTAWGYVLAGPSEDGTWPIQFEDGSTELAFVLSGDVIDLRDLAKKAREAWYQDKFEGRTYPYGEGGRWAGGTGADIHGRQRRGIAEFLG